MVLNAIGDGKVEGLLLEETTELNLSFYVYKSISLIIIILSCMGENLTNCLAKQF